MDDFNSAVWDEMLDLFKSDGVAEVVDALMADLPEQQRRFSMALQGGNQDSLRRIAHVLRGSSLQLGAEALARLCADAEKAAAGDDIGQAVKLGTQIIERYAVLVENWRSAAERF